MQRPFASSTEVAIAILRSTAKQTELRKATHEALKAYDAYHAIATTTASYARRLEAKLQMQLASRRLARIVAEGTVL